MSISASIIRKRAPGLEDNRVEALAAVWDEVVHRIVETMLSHENGEERELHINVKADMVQELARLQVMLAEKLIERRAADRDLKAVDPAAERRACFEPAGLKMVEATARVAYEHVWHKYMTVRWLPKSRKALEREANPSAPAKLAVKPVNDQHFISRWFIRDYWAEGDKTMRWRQEHGEWLREHILFARWGHRRRVWSDRVEAYFGLLEGDAKRPIQQLLASEPLSPPQQEAFIAYLVIHLLRSPTFIDGLRQNLRQQLEEAAQATGTDVDAIGRSAYATLFCNNALYDRLARPLLWSQWAIVSSPDPVFVLPDTFCARGKVDGELRLIVPLTPRRCFVTLAAKEEKKRIVPFHHAADKDLAGGISQLLVQAAASEFLAERSFSAGAVGEASSFGDVLTRLGVGVQ